MDHTTSSARTSLAWQLLGARAAGLLLGTLAACGGGDNTSSAASSAASIAGASEAVQLARTTVVRRSDPLVQSSNNATSKLAQVKCTRRARTEAGEGISRRAARQNARRESCDAAFEARRAG